MPTKRLVKKPVIHFIFFCLPVLAFANTDNDLNKISHAVLKSQDSLSIPVRVHPDNQKCFLFRGRPTVFLTATEHYGSVMNRPFRYERYLADAAAKGITYSRLFLLFRELQSATNPYSTCKPESPDYIAPFLRTGPGNALDGELKYDLNQWNPEFFTRLKNFLDLASHYGIVVEITLLSNTYEPDVWALNPINWENNINGMENIDWPTYMSARNSKIFEVQKKYVRKIVEFTKGYDNIIYEICNEPGGNMHNDKKNPQPPEVNQWLMQIGDIIRDTEKDLPNKHLVVGEESYNDSPWTQTTDSSFRGLKFDVVNIHPLPSTTYHGKNYNMGDFMSKQLKLQEFHDYCLDTYHEPKPLNMDEDNVASQYKDYEAWTIDRKRAWVAMFSGAHYDLIDFSIINYSETGTDSSQKYLRTWFKNLSGYMRTVDIVKAKPQTNWLREKPSNVLEADFIVTGRDYNIYLADVRERTDKDAGKPIQGNIRFDLPDGQYEIKAYSSESGLYSPGIKISGAKNIQFATPEIVGDIVIRITRIN